MQQAFILNARMLFALWDIDPYQGYANEVKDGEDKTKMGEIPTMMEKIRTMQVLQSSVDNKPYVRLLSRDHITNRQGNYQVFGRGVQSRKWSLQFWTRVDYCIVWAICRITLKLELFQTWRCPLDFREFHTVLLLHTVESVCKTSCVLRPSVLRDLPFRAPKVQFSM